MDVKKIALLLLFVGCSASKETRIEDRTITVVPPVIADTLNTYVLYGGERDTIYIGERIVERDTVIVAKFFPQEKKIYVKVKPDTIKVTYRDTVSIVQENVIETPFLSKVGLVAIGAGIVFVLLVVLWFTRRVV